MNKLSQYLQTPTINYWRACKRILRYIKGTLSYGLYFKPAQVMSLEGYADAGWGSNIMIENLLVAYASTLVEILSPGVPNNRK